MHLKKIFAISLLLVSFSYATFDPCKFNFGTDWDYLNTKQSSSVAQQVDYVTIWLVDASFNPGWHGAMLDFCKANNKTPVFYSYIIAKASALGDADVGGALATKGANFIRNNWSTVTDRYKNYASNTASKWGTSSPVIWLMEPDFYQYAASTQEGGGLSFSDLGKKMSELISIVKQYLPNAQISMDISAWVEDQGNTSSWFGAMPLGSMNYINTTGGRSEANNSKIVSANKLTWSGASNVTNKGIIADAGYGTGGGSAGENTSWNDVNNIKARIADGVIAITQKSPTDGWGNTIQSLRTSLSGQTIKSCSGQPKTTYTLSVTTSGSGNVTVSPQAASYESGTTVTLTAVPSSGQTFSGWSKDLSGTSTTATLVMNGNKTVTATFIAISKPKYTLSVTTSGSGSVSVNPQAASYDSGSTVTLTAAPSSGQAFSGWSIDLSGTSTTATLVMNGNKTVTATFSGTSKPKYTLTVTTSGSGSISLIPQATSYDSGSTVSLKAVPSSGASFSGWGGALSGTNVDATLVMSSDKTVSASFSGGNTSASLVTNGDFSNGTTGWNLGVYGGAAATNSVQNGAHVVTATTAGSAAWNIQLTQTAVKLEQGKSYVFSFTANASSSISIVVNIGNATTYTSYLGEKTITLTTQAQTFTYPFTMTAATDNVARVEFNSGLTTGTWYLDNVSVTEGTAVIRKNNSSNQSKRLTKYLIPSDFFETGKVSISLYDHSGRFIQKITNITQGAAINFEKSSGRFVAVITSGNKRVVRNLLTLE